MKFPVSDIVVVSNRLPFKLENGSSYPEKAVSGLVSAVEPVIRETGGTWVGWNGAYLKKNRTESGV